MNKILGTRITSVKDITSALLNYAETFSFIVREKTDVSDELIDLLESLRIYLIEIKRVSEWPGTILLWDHVILYTYHLNIESAFVLFTSEDYLFDWLLPRLPEDLVFYKDNRPLFISITHEKEAYFKLEGDDENFLKSKNFI